MGVAYLASCSYVQFQLWTLYDHEAGQAVSSQARLILWPPTLLNRWLPTGSLNLFSVHQMIR